MKFFVSAVVGGAVVLASQHAGAAIRTLQGQMTGSQEVPPVTTGGTALCTATLDDVTGAVSATANYSGLTSNATLGHIHGLAGPGVNAGVIVNGTVTSATSGTLTVNGTLTPAQITGMLAGQTYCNIHTVNNGGGEIRGQLNLVAAAPATSPWSLALLGLGVLGAGTALLAARRTRAVV